jgi:hypothetical protein
LMKQNLELKPLWNKINLNKNNIILSLSKIWNISYNLRDAKYPDKNYILKDISKITIDLGKERPLKNLPFCPIKNSFINFNKSNRTESYIKFTTIWQLNYLTILNICLLMPHLKLLPEIVIKR